MNYSEFFNDVHRFPLTKVVINIMQNLTKRSNSYLQYAATPPMGATQMHILDWRTRSAEDNQIIEQLRITALTYELNEILTYLNIPTTYEEPLYSEMQARKLSIENYLKTCTIQPL